MTKWLKERVLLTRCRRSRSTIAFTPPSREHTTPVRPSQNPKRTCLFPLLSVLDRYSDALSHPRPLTTVPTSLSIVHNKRSCRIRRRNPFVPVPSEACGTNEPCIDRTGENRQYRLRAISRERRGDVT